MPLILNHLDADRPRPYRYNRPQPVRCGADPLAFALAPVYPGWFLIPVGPSPEAAPLTLNGAPVADVTRLGFGDVLQIEGTKLVVDGATCAAEPARTAPVAPSAAVAVLLANREVCRARVERAGAVGTAPGCAVRVPPETELAEHHAAVAHVGGRWHLFVFKKEAGAHRLGDEPAHALALTPGESVWLNARVELTVTCEELDPLDLPPPRSGVRPGLASASRGSIALPPPAPATIAALVPTESVTRAGDETPAPIALPQPPARRAAVASLDPANPVHVAIKDLYDSLCDAHARTPPRAARTVSALPFAPWFTPGGTSAEVRQVAAELTADPWDPDALFALAELFRRLGLTAFSSWVLAELRRQNRADPVVNLSFGRLCAERAADPALPPADRIELLNRAERYLGDALRANPGDRTAADLLAKVGTDRTIMQLP